MCAHTEYLQRMSEKGRLVRLPAEFNSSNKNNIFENYYSDGILKYFQFLFFARINKQIESVGYKESVRLKQILLPKLI